MSKKMPLDTLWSGFFARLKWKIRQMQAFVDDFSLETAV
jgi:hypothetical protein